MRFSKVNQLTVVAVWISGAHGTQDPRTLVDRASSAAQLLLDKYYDRNTGLLGNLWWNSAAAYNELADLQATMANSTKPPVEEILATAFDKAHDPESADDKTRPSTFLNGFYDDEAWWALTWVAAYDLTQNSTYLQKAESIWQDITGGWQTGGCGGLWWDKAHTQVNAVEHELFISLSAHLANRETKSKDQYLKWAETTWDWFSHSGMVNRAGGIVQDAYDHTACHVVQSQLTYTNGIILGALLELNRASPKPYYLSNATAIADATIAAERFTDDKGIFQEPVGSFDNNTMQFKGIFMRNLRLLQRHAPKQTYVDFATKNADSIWASRWTDGQIGPQWDTNTGTAPYVGSHSSGMSALLAAGAMLMPNDAPDVITRRSSRFWNSRA